MPIKIKIANKEHSFYSIDEGCLFDFYVIMSSDTKWECKKSSILASCPPRTITKNLLYCEIEMVRNNREKLQKALHQILGYDSY